MGSKKSSKVKHKIVAKVVTNESERVGCAFCHRNVDDEVIYGKYYVYGDIQCHYFCVLLSSCLVQKGDDDEGLLGFMYEEIVAEIERAKKCRCSYCGRLGATLGCSISQCKKQFHLACGRERSAVSMFYGNFRSFCQHHAPQQQVTEGIMAKALPRMQMDKRKARKKKSVGNFSDLKELCPNTNEDVPGAEAKESVCVICYEPVQGYPTVNTFWPPCCARDAWFHRTCLQRMALSAGMHYLKCPLCNDKDNFYQAVLSQGYYVPDRDAAWELEQNAFAEIYERPLTCDVETCRCPEGRDHDSESGAWDIKLCLLCGSSGAHFQCIDEAPRYVCTSCKPAADDNLEVLQEKIEKVIIQEQRQRSRPVVRQGPVMPPRMSLRRTKGRTMNNTPSNSSCQSSSSIIQSAKVEETSNTTSSRLELNLKTPKRHTSVLDSAFLKNIENSLLSPVKMLEQKLSEKVSLNEVKEKLDGQVVEEMRMKFKKPKPLCEKKKIVNSILEELLRRDVQGSTSDASLKDEVVVNPTDSKIEEPSQPTDTKNIKSDCPNMEQDVEKMRMNFKKPQPLCEKKKTVNSILEGLLSKGNNSTATDSSNEASLKAELMLYQNDLENEPPSQPVDTEKANHDNSVMETQTENPVKVTLVKQEIDDHINDSVIELIDDESNSTFQLSPEFLAENLSDESLPGFDTQNKLRTVEIEKDSSMEISKNNEIINVDLLKIDSNCEIIDLTSTDVTKKMTMKFSPKGKGVLEETPNWNLDIDVFKYKYLSEVDKDFKCHFEHSSKLDVDNSVYKLSTIDFAFDAVKKEADTEAGAIKRKMETKDKVPKKKRRVSNEIKENFANENSNKNNKRKKKSKKKHKKHKTQVSINDKNIQVKIKWKEERLKVQFTKGKKKKSKNLKQCVLSFSPEAKTQSDVLSMPVTPVTPIKKKKIKQEYSPDNLVQTSIHRFFGNNRIEN